jgi:protein RecA
MAKKTNTAATFDTKNAIQSLAAVARKALSNEAVFSGTESDLGEPQHFLPTGIEELDEVLEAHKRGYPMGRIIEVFGESQTGKTTLAYNAIAKVQERGGMGVLFTAEGEFSRTLALSYGINTDNLLVVDSNIVEEVFETMHKLIEANKEIPMVIVVDSVAGLSTNAEVANATFDQDRQAQMRAQLISKALRIIGALIPRSPHLLYLINQVNEGEVSPQGFKSKAKPVGGKRIGFYASLRLRVEHLGKVYRTKDKKKYVAGLKVRVTAEKNRLNTPFGSCDLIIDFEKGLRSASSKTEAEEVDE